MNWILFDICRDNCFTFKQTWTDSSMHESPLPPSYYPMLTLLFCPRTIAYITLRLFAGFTSANMPDTVPYVYMECLHVKSIHPNKESTRVQIAQQGMPSCLPSSTSSQHPPRQLNSTLSKPNCALTNTNRLSSHKSCRHADPAPSHKNNPHTDSSSQPYPFLQRSPTKP